MLFPIFVFWYFFHRSLISCPTRRSSDLFDVFYLSHRYNPGRPKGRLGPSAASAAAYPRGIGTASPIHFASFPREGTSPESVRSEEHTSELQSRGHLVCRLLLEKKKPHV